MNRTTTQQSILGEDTYKSFRKELEKEQQREFHLKIGVASALFWSFWLVRIRFSFASPSSLLIALYFRLDLPSSILPKVRTGLSPGIE